MQGQQVAMLQLVKPYTAEVRADAAGPSWPPRGPGEGMLPFDVSLTQVCCVLITERGLVCAPVQNRRKQMPM
jgi:hypothetical protein